MTKNPKAHFLSENAAHLTEDLGVDAVAFGSEFWGQLEDNPHLLKGRVFGVVHKDPAPPTFKEMHPEGDEILFVHYGQMDVILYEDEAEEVIPLSKGQWALIPKGVWHTIHVKAPTEVIFITPMEGTEGKPL